MHLDLVETCKPGFYILVIGYILFCPLPDFSLSPILRYHGVYLGEDVAVKILRSEQLNNALEDEFAQEVAIMR